MPATRKTADTAKKTPAKSRRTRNGSAELRPLDADRTPRREEIELHGHRVVYWTAGSGDQVVLLIHGITGNARQWEPVATLLAERYTVLAPDLLGHGESAKPRGDYSLGAYAAGVRDLMIALGHRRATVVGHSLGGGIAMQFAYEYPPFAERLVLASSGGIGREVHALLRASTLPGSEIVIPLLASRRVVALGSAFGAALERLGLRAGPDLEEMGRGIASLADSGARQAFVHTMRAVLDAGGQRVSATDRLYLTAMMPSLVMWGDRDPLIPVHHAQIAHREMPGSRLEIFDGIGHFPQLQAPVLFAQTLADFIETTEPATFEFGDDDLALFREQMLRRSSASGSSAGSAKRRRQAASG